VAPFRRKTINRQQFQQLKKGHTVTPDAEPKQSVCSLQLHLTFSLGTLAGKQARSNATPALKQRLSGDGWHSGQEGFLGCSLRSYYLRPAGERSEIHHMHGTFPNPIINPDREARTRFSWQNGFEQQGSIITSSLTEGNRARSAATRSGLTAAPRGLGLPSPRKRARLEGGGGDGASAWDGSSKKEDDRFRYIAAHMVVAAANAARAADSCSSRRVG
jgi:hypothetical protein